MGFGEEVLIDKCLRPLLDAEETKFFNEGKTRINVEALGIRLAVLRTAFELHGSYAPRDPKEAAQYGVRIIGGGIPWPPNEFNHVDVIPESALSRHGVHPLNPTKQPANGTPPAVKNGNKDGDA
jgi:hypothetical protein